MKQINKSQVCVVSDNEWTIEASTAGFAPGEWPNKIEVADREAGKFYTFDVPQPVTSNGELIAVVYMNEWNITHKLRVLND